MAESLAHQAVTGLDAERPVGNPKLVDQAGVIGRVGHGGDAKVVLRGSTDHAGAADIDVRAGLLGGDAFLRDRLAEGVEVDDDHVDRDALRTGEVGLVGLVVCLGQETEVDLEIECLDEPALHLGLPRVVGDGHEVLAGVFPEDLGDRLVRAPGGENPDAGIDLEQGGDEGVESGFIGHADEDVLDCNVVVDLADDIESHGASCKKSVLNEDGTIGPFLQGRRPIGGRSSPSV